MIFTIGLGLCFFGRLTIYLNPDYPSSLDRTAVVFGLLLMAVSVGIVAWRWMP